MSRTGSACTAAREKPPRQRTYHKDPVVRGGENERYNYQILCKPCNQRKGMQTDGEFRQRYAELLPRFHHGQALMPPERPTPQKAFRQLTKETEMAETAREFKRTGNQRKGMQTDGEFRQRYAELLPRFHHGQALMPPERPTPQKAFRQLTKETEMAETAREFKRTKYISPPARRSQEQSWEYPVSSAQR